MCDNCVISSTIEPVWETDTNGRYATTVLHTCGELCARTVRQKSNLHTKNAFAKNKEKTIQQQKGLPTLSADLNERALAGNSNHKYQFNSKITRLQCMEDGYQMRTGLEAEGGCLRVRTCFFFSSFFFLFDFNEAKGFYVWVCVNGLFPRIEPVGKPYREVCLQTEWWPWKVHQPNSWSKRPGTWIAHVLAYCRVGRKYVGCIELLFKLYRAIWRL